MFNARVALEAIKGELTLEGAMNRIDAVILRIVWIALEWFT